MRKESTSEHCSRNPFGKTSQATFSRHSQRLAWRWNAAFLVLIFVLAQPIHVAVEAFQSVHSGTSKVVNTRRIVLHSQLLYGQDSPDVTWPSVDKAPNCTIWCKRSCYVERGACVDAAHVRWLSHPVIGVILDYAKRIDPKVIKTYVLRYVNRMLKHFADCLRRITFHKELNSALL